MVYKLLTLSVKLYNRMIGNNMEEIKLKEIKHNKSLTKLLIKIARNLQMEYHDYYYFEGLYDTFNDEYAYMFKDIMGSGQLIEIKPWEYENRMEILEKNAKKGAFYVGFPIPWYE